MRYFLIMNPSSRGGKSKTLFNKIFSLLDKQTIRYEYEVTSSPHKAYELSVHANLNGYDVIVAVGGDGTINRVLNGFFNAEGKRISASRFGVIYTGTSPDFCKSYGIPINTEEAVKTLLCDNSQEIRIGKIAFLKELNTQFEGKTFKDIQSKTDPKYLTAQYFGCCANIGIGAQVAARANSGVRKYLGDIMGTFSALVRTLVTYKPYDILIDIDGQKAVLEKVYNIFIGKTFYVASGLKVKNELTPDDKRLYCLIVQKINPISLMKVLRIIYGGKKFTGNSTICLRYGEIIEIAGNNQNPQIEFDGDPVGFLPCRIETAADALSLICEVNHEQRERNDQADFNEYAKV